MARHMTETNGVLTNGDAMPPPSTLAAQIVQNQTRPAAPQQNGQDATLAQLLHEMLYNPATVQETNPAVNVQLVSVVVEAGLGPLASDNPFAQFDVLIPQAKDSITVVEKTVKRQPHLLLTPISEDGPQLALPLLARLIAVCGRPKCQDLPIPALIDSLIKTLSASAEVWQSAKTLQQVIQDMVDGT